MVTHAVQFSGVPWLRPYLAGLLGDLLGSLEVKVDPRALLKLPSTSDVKGLVESLKRDGLVGALAGGGRRELLEIGGRKEIAMMMPVIFLVLPVTVLFALFPGFVGLSLAS